MFRETKGFLLDTPQADTSTQSAKKRSLGVYFTPDAVTRTLCYWAIRAPSDLVLEPSFGGCGFLESAANRLRSLGTRTPWRNLYGCDVQQDAFEHLPKRVRAQADQRFIRSDFLALRYPRGWPAGFHAVVGNPPYVSNHNLSATKRKVALRAIGLVKDAISLPSTASLWAYFVVHSMSFLRPEGRLALVLPRSLLDAEYALAIRRYVAANFERSVVMLVQKQLFRDEGADEQTVCLLADNKGTPSRNSDLAVGEVGDERELLQRIQRWEKGTWKPPAIGSRPTFSLLSPNAKKAVARVASAKECRPLGAYCTIRIGIVTGANKFFLFSRNRQKEERIPLYCFAPVVCRSIDLGGLAYSEADHVENLEADVRCLVLNATSMSARGKQLSAYLRKFPHDLRASNVTFGKRQFWYRPSDHLLPDAFFPYMQEIGPRLCLNMSESLCTNTIHRVFFKRPLPLYKRRAVCLSILTTFSQLSAELEGRSYGSGVLKHEPGEAARIKMFLPRSMSIPKINEAFEKVDDHLRRGHWDAAHLLADKVIFGTKFEKEIRVLKRVLIRLRTVRRAKK